MTEDYSAFGYTGDGTAEDLLAWALDRYHPRIAVACSLQHAVVAHMASRIQPQVRVFSVDTGRLLEETYECARDLEQVLGVRIEWYFPRHEAVEQLLRSGGTHSFRASVQARQDCCGVRKLEPTRRALTGLEAWVSGLRRDQAASRHGRGKLEWDGAREGLLKVNPIADWSTEQTREYGRRHGLPHNRLLDRGYTSIGCACCTRAIEPGEDARAGRWWWELDGHKECGLHVADWSI